MLGRLAVLEFRHHAAALPRRAILWPTARADGSSDGPTSERSPPADDASRAVGFGAFHAVYGRHRPEETDKIRLFRLIKQPSSPWVGPDDVQELVWAVAETHVGLEFLRDSEEFLKSYVQTTTLRILWGLGGMVCRAAQESSPCSPRSCVTSSGVAGESFSFFDASSADLGGGPPFKKLVSSSWFAAPGSAE